MGRPAQRESPPWNPSSTPLSREGTKRNQERFIAAGPSASGELDRRAKRAKTDQLRARHRLSKFLLRHGEGDAAGGKALSQVWRLQAGFDETVNIVQVVLPVRIDGSCPQTAQAIATYDENVANYRQTVLTGFQEVEDNLAALKILEQEAAVQDEQIPAITR